MPSAADRGGSWPLALAAAVFAAAGLFATLVSKGVADRGLPVPSDFPADKDEASCAYRECADPPEGRVTFKVEADAWTVGNRTTLTLSEATLPLCADHAEGARTHRWPDHPYRWLALLVVGVVSAVAGLIAMAVALMATRKPAPRKGGP